MKSFNLTMVMLIFMAHFCLPELLFAPPGEGGDEYYNEIYTVYTPKNNPVTASEYQYTYWNGNIYYDWSEEFVESYRYNFEQAPQNQNKTVLGDITKTYDCHGYAWHMVEWGDTVWIDTGDENTYWTNSSYISTTQGDASKVSYGPIGHSAMIPNVNNQSWVYSKWGNKLLVAHPYNDCPYYPWANITYYKLNPNIDGSSLELCENDERTFNLNISIPGSTYTWTRDEDRLDYVSGSGTTSYNVEAKSNISGTAWVRLQITTPSGEIAITPYKYLFVGIPFAPTYMSTGDPLCRWQYIQFDLENPGNPSWTYYDWRIGTEINANIYYGQGTLHASIYSYDEGYVTMSVAAQNECGTTDYLYSDPLYIEGCYGRMMIYPNPATNELKVELTKEVDNNAVLEILNSQVIKVISVPIKDKMITIDISKLPKGIYYVTLLNRGKVTTSKFIKE